MASFPVPVFFFFLTCYLLLSSLRAKFGSHAYGRVGHFSLLLSTFKFLYATCYIKGLFYPGAQIEAKRENIYC